MTPPFLVRFIQLVAPLAANIPLLCVAGCYHPVVIASGHVSQSAAVDLADAVLVREQHVDVLKYKKTILSEDQEWSILYEFVAPPGEVVLGRHYAVVVSKVTGDARILKGD